MKHLLVLLSLFACGAALAADNTVRHGFWGDIDIGVGRLHLSPDVASDRTTTRLYYALSGGYTLHPQLQLGVEAGAWNINTIGLNYSNTSEGLIHLFAVARYWPTANSKLFIKAAGGRVSHWNNQGSATEGTGHGYTLGLGYELARVASTETYWFLNYNAGNINGYTPAGGVKQDENYHALAVGLSFSF